MIKNLGDPTATVYYLRNMNDEDIRKVLAEIGRRGGLARAKAMTAKQRKESALKASKAAAKARTKKARAKAGKGKRSKRATANLNDAS